MRPVQFATEQMLLAPDRMEDIPKRCVFHHWRKTEPVLGLRERLSADCVDSSSQFRITLLTLRHASNLMNHQIRDAGKVVLGRALQLHLLDERTRVRLLLTGVDHNHSEEVRSAERVEQSVVPGKPRGDLA